jgi:xylan 1,4-beta-xylosidase
MRYRNPILPGFHPDPSICRVGDDFYLVTSSFEYFPGVPVFHSRDLVNWRQIGHCLTRDSQLPLKGARASGGIFAPTIRYHGGRFYMVTTDVTGIGNFFVWTEDPAGEWSDPIPVDQPGIDPSLFFDTDGRVYFASTQSATDPVSGGGFQSEIDITTGALLGPTRLLWRGTGGQYAEGPHVFYRDGWYYVLLAEGGTEFGHMVTIARSRSIWGPFEPFPHNPILTHRSLDTPLQSTGHSDLVEDGAGRWWLVFLACRHVGYPKRHHIGRETCLAPVEWPADGWPVVNGGKPVPLEVETDRPIGVPSPDTPVRDDFDRDTLSLYWNFRRNPDPTAWSLTEKPGSLSLRCVAATLGEIASPAFLGRRQQHLTCTAQARLAFTPANPGDEAGLTVFMNEEYRVDLAITNRDGQRVALLRRCVGTLTAEPVLLPLPEGDLTLEVRAEPEWYHFTVRPDTGEALALGKVETRHLSTEMAGGFTGVYFGMYATGNGTDSATRAAFDWFAYRPGLFDTEAGGSYNAAENTGSSDCQ